MKTVPSLYTLLINTICLSHSTPEALGTVFRKHAVKDMYLGKSGHFEVVGGEGLQVLEGRAQSPGLDLLDGVLT